SRRRSPRRPYSGNARIMSSKLKVAVLGATGYSGLELTRILLRHPRVETPVFLRRPESQNSHLAQSAGKSGAALSEENGQANLADVFPALSGNGSYPLQALSWPALKTQAVEILFLASPHEVSCSLLLEAVATGM